jgi:hypothetical protein
LSQSHSAILYHSCLLFVKFPFFEKIVDLLIAWPELPQKTLRIHPLTRPTAIRASALQSVSFNLHVTNLACDVPQADCLARQLPRAKQDSRNDKVIGPACGLAEAEPRGLGLEDEGFAGALGAVEFDAIFLVAVVFEWYSCFVGDALRVCNELWPCLEPFSSIADAPVVRVAKWFDVNKVRRCVRR